MAETRPDIARLAWIALFSGAAVQYAWNAWNVTPLTGYDAAAHAAYALSIREDGGLPNPYDTFSSFHPPLYYALAAALWALLEPLGPRWVVAGLRAPGALALLAAGAVSARVVLRLGSPWPVAWVATALVLFVPCIQLAGAMVGNEALAAGLSALAIPPLLALQRNPRDARAALWTGGLAGLALAAKYSGGFVAVACAVPFLRRDFDRRMLRSLGALLALGALVAGPVYARNAILTGTPVPVVRQVEPMKSAEDANVLRPRRVVDYLWLDPRALLRPSIHHVAGSPPPPPPRRNPAMTNVWGLAYASAWYDAQGHRIPLAYHRDGVAAGPLLALLGIAPTGVLLLGFLLALSEAARRRLRSPDAPLVVASLIGLAAFVAFTAFAQSTVSVKASYLIPLAPAAAAFFARGAGRLRGVLRRATLALGAAAALAAALVFSSGLWFPPQPPEWMGARWLLLGEVLPHSHITEATRRLVPGLPPPAPEVPSDPALRPPAGGAGSRGAPRRPGA